MELDEIPKGYNLLGMRSSWLHRAVNNKISQRLYQLEKCPEDFRQGWSYQSKIDGSPKIGHATIFYGQF
jgi:hypothetical protein